MPRSEKRVELGLGGEDKVLFTSLRVAWKLLSPSWCPHPQASLNEETTEEIIKLILSHRVEPKDKLD